METKNQLYIFGKKEIGLLIAMGLGIASFSFTLGIHMGKRIAPKGVEAKSNSGTPLETASDKIPDRHELAEQAKGVQGAADESLNQSLHDEVTRTGIKLDVPRQIELPKNSKNKAGGATTSHAQTHAESKAEPEKAAEHSSEKSDEKKVEKAEKGGESEKSETKPEAKTDTTPDAKSDEDAPLATHPEKPKSAAAKHEPAPVKHEEATKEASHDSAPDSAAEETSSGKYALQVGSFPTRGEAEARLKEIGGSGLASSIHEADVKGKGTWYRVYLGGFSTKKIAEKAADSLQKKKQIDHFVVVENQ